MKCPFCEKMEDKVLESRQNGIGTTIRRRRECLACGYRFTSYEKIEEITIKVIKKDGSREPFDKKKIERGLHRAIEKRPVTQLQIDEVLNTLEDEVDMKCRGTHEIQSSELGDMVMSTLFGLDKVAYVRFASVYQKFENVDEFVDVIHNLSKKNSKNI
ncbi:MAG: transcriptional regulator NrdR [Spirochaetales bacterium]|nr:transcriptional regulator NrdR [Spirochaetales bacterium]